MLRRTPRVWTDNAGSHSSARLAIYFCIHVAPRNSGTGALTCHSPMRPHFRQRPRAFRMCRSPIPSRTSLARSVVAQRRQPEHQQSRPWPYSRKSEGVQSNCVHYGSMMRVQAYPVSLHFW